MSLKPAILALAVIGSLATGCAHAPNDGPYHSRGYDTSEVDYEIDPAIELANTIDSLAEDLELYIKPIDLDSTD